MFVAIVTTKNTQKKGSKEEGIGTSVIKLKKWNGNDYLIVLTHLWIIQGTSVPSVPYTHHSHDKVCKDIQMYLGQ